jgi:hypothetical protein
MADDSKHKVQLIISRFKPDVYGFEIVYNLVHTKSSRIAYYYRLVRYMAFHHHSKLLAKPISRFVLEVG